MRELTIGANDAGQRLDKFLQKAFPALPVSLMHKYLRRKRIKRNGARAEGGDRLVEGDRLALYVSDELLEGRQEAKAPLIVKPDIAVVYEDDNLLIVDKPAGLLCHSDDRESVHTLIAQIQAYLYAKGEYDPTREQSFAPALCNRLDRNTAGLCLAAKNAAALRELNEIIRRRQLRKFYLALVEGCPRPAEGRLRGYLLRDRERAQVSILKSPAPGARSIETRYRVLRSDGARSLVEVELITGRTHQIRAHFASIGHPLCGDGKYGRAGRNRQQPHQALCAYKVAFALEDTQGILSYLDNTQYFSTQTAVFDGFS
ncbi:MAG: RluA family pseudouridine synthase [Clostridiales bacterium]|nr:RluA family pseudouridine synthase [Clostridiales bacterium]